ncbi:retroviral-like aspartic protease family protein [Dyella sp. C9]|uniref:retroviral-like aspartic protease family protein n=1 Tax=Dyella sp. C9 TaxID=2202154 RepID=UPI000DEF6698|nr:retroviral-like aspartic protease family protein [Dyella sp. C9]
MIRLRALALAWMLSVVFTPGASANANELPPGSPVPMTAAGDGHDTVPVYVDGKGPFPFILDSGADGSAVYAWFAEQMQLKKLAGHGQDLSGQTGSARVDMYRVGDLSLAGMHLRNVEAFGLPNRHDAGIQAGVLGNDFMDQALAVFDFPCHRVELYPRSTPIEQIVGPHAQAIHAGIDPGTTLLTVPVTVNGYAGVAVVDTGSRRTRLTTAFAKGAGLDPASSSFRDDDPIYGTSQHELVPRTGPIGEVGVAGLTFMDANAQVIDLPVLTQDFGGKPAMILGADLLGRYRLVYDHASHTLWLPLSRCPLP